MSSPRAPLVTALQVGVVFAGILLLGGPFSFASILLVDAYWNVESRIDTTPANWLSIFLAADWLAILREVWSIVFMMFSVGFMVGLGDAFADTKDGWRQYLVAGFFSMLFSGVFSSWFFWGLREAPGQAISDTISITAFIFLLFAIGLFLSAFDWKRSARKQMTKPTR
jgi:hypothetical protein